MPWRAPRTWDNSVLTAQQLNQQLRDNMLETGPAKVTTAGDLLVADGPNSLDRLPIGSALQQLRVNTAGSAAEWVTGGGAWAKVAAGEATSGTTVVIQNFGNWRRLNLIVRCAYAASTTVRNITILADDGATLRSTYWRPAVGSSTSTWNVGTTFTTGTSSRQAVINAMIFSSGTIATIHGLLATCGQYVGQFVSTDGRLQQTTGRATTSPLTNYLSRTGFSFGGAVITEANYVLLGQNDIS